MPNDSDMNPARLRFEVVRDLYQSQRARREQIRDSVATPVAALAFTVYCVSGLATAYNAGQLSDPINHAIAWLAAGSIVCLLGGAFLIVRVERKLVYLDPPDLEEMVASEKQLREHEDDDERIGQRLHDLMAGAYDIVYQRYFTANEQAARDRTRGLHLVLAALSLTALCFALLPFQAGAGS
jgi:hypothetical protein